MLEKQVGETPLAAIESWRASELAFNGIPLAYAGRLDPMASGKLLVLIGDECKVQEKYHRLDKRYEFEVLFGVSSDTGDVLGRLQYENVPNIDTKELKTVSETLVGSITLPYPHFSSKTVKGKPLHVWTLEGRLSEIEIPTYTARVYSLKFISARTMSGHEIANEALTKIETIPPVTEASKALGQDFRRVDVRTDWHAFKTAHGEEKYTIAKFSCVSGSGAYMRSLSELIAKNLGTKGLAYSIHRSRIGKVFPVLGRPIWTKIY